MELELRYLSGYLPYKLKVYAGYNEYVLVLEEDCNSDDISFREMIENNHKPILHPLSDLTRRELELAGFDSHIDYLTYENKGVEWTLKAPFNMVQYLLSKHFDIYGLIENNLAIDINTLKL